MLATQGDIAILHNAWLKRQTSWCPGCHPGTCSSYLWGSPDLRFSWVWFVQRNRRSLSCTWKMYSLSSQRWVNLSLLSNGQTQWEFTADDTPGLGCPRISRCYMQTPLPFLWGFLGTWNIKWPLRDYCKSYTPWGCRISCKNVSLEYQRLHI